MASSSTPWRRAADYTKPKYCRYTDKNGGTSAEAASRPKLALGNTERRAVSPPRSDIIHVTQAVTVDRVVRQRIHSEPTEIVSAAGQSCPKLPTSSIESSGRAPWKFTSRPPKMRNQPTN